MITSCLDWKCLPTPFQSWVTLFSLARGNSFYWVAFWKGGWGLPTL